VTLYTAEVIIKTKMKLRGDMFGGMIADHGDIPSMLVGMAKINTLPAATLPLLSRARVVLEGLM
jgi:hypothetical protein